MRIILGEAAHAHDAVQRAGGLVAVTRAEFGQPERQVTVGMQAGIENLHVTGAVHRLDRVVAVFRRGGEHVVAVVLPVAGLLPQAAVHHGRRPHFLVAVLDELLPHVLLDLLPHDPALGVPERHARRLVLHVEEIEQPGELAVIALLRLFQTVQVGIEVFLLRPGRAIDALQHGVLRIAAPVGAGQLHQLERARQPAGRWQMRAAADVEPLALTVDGQFLALGDHLVDDLHLVGFTQSGEHLHRLLARPHLTLDRQVALDDLVHALLDLLQIFRGERIVAREVVVEAVLDGGTDGDLGAGIKLLHCLRHYMRGVVANEIECLGVPGGDDGQCGVMVDQVAGVDEPAVDPAGERRLGEPRADGRRDLRDGHGGVELSNRTVGKRDVDHAGKLQNKKSADRPRSWITGDAETCSDAPGLSSDDRASSRRHFATSTGRSAHS